MRTLANLKTDTCKFFKINLKDMTIAQQKKMQVDREKIVSDIKYANQMSDFNFKTNTKKNNKNTKKNK